MDIAITKMSSRGQVVIPTGMRKGIEEGEKMVIIQDKGHLIIQKAGMLGKKLAEDLKFAKKTEEALKRYEKGGFAEMNFDEFLKEAEKW